MAVLSLLTSNISARYYVQLALKNVETCLKPFLHKHPEWSQHPHSALSPALLCCLLSFWYHGEVPFKFRIPRTIPLCYCTTYFLTIMGTSRSRARFGQQTMISPWSIQYTLDSSIVTSGGFFSSLVWWISVTWQGMGFVFYACLIKTCFIYCVCSFYFLPLCNLCILDFICYSVKYTACVDSLVQWLTSSPFDDKHTLNSQRPLHHRSCHCQQGSQCRKSGCGHLKVCSTLSVFLSFFPLI